MDNKRPKIKILMKLDILFSSIALLCGVAMFSASAQSPQVPSMIIFAGETISFEDQYHYERMDREILSFCYMHTNSTLMLKRASKIFPIVEPILKEMGIPDDLKYLMAIESNLSPTARSSAGAAGLWQLMPTTAKEYGLEVRNDVDERYHIEKSTRAACRYLKSAYSEFGDWMTTAASYNAGRAGIKKRLEEQKEDNAMNLWLVEETSRYMFRILAAKMMFENPSRFGFDIQEKDRYPFIPARELVKVNTDIDNLVDFAMSKGTSYAKLKRANLWLRSNKLSNPNKKEYTITIPNE